MSTGPVPKMIAAVTNQYPYRIDKVISISISISMRLIMIISFVQTFLLDVRFQRLNSLECPLLYFIS